MISKTLKIFSILLIFCTALVAQKSLFPSQEQNFNAGILLSPENAKAPITLTRIPTKFYRNGDSTATGNITIQWNQPGIFGDFYFSRFPNVAANLRSPSPFPGDSVLDNSSTDNLVTFNVGS